MVPPRPRLSALALLFALAGSLEAQLPPLTVPGGQLRFDIGGRFSWWDQAYVGGEKAPAIGPFLRNPLDGSVLPGLAPSEAALRAVTGIDDLSLTPGSTTGALAVNLGSAELGAALGITSRVTIFGLVPIVRVRVQQQLLIDSTGATAGFNPADARFGTSAGLATTNAFLAELSNALASLSAAIQASRYDENPAQLAEAQAALARGTALQSGLEELLLQSPFLPITGTPGAVALTGAIDSIRTRLTALDPDSTGVPPIQSLPALPESRLLPGALEEYLTRTGGPVETSPFEPEIYQALGDVEVGLAVALLTGRSPARGVSVRSVLRGTVRLPTGRRPDPNALFAVGTGQGQGAIRGDLVTDIMGSRFGARLSGAFTRQQPAEFERRVTPPDQPFAPRATLAVVERQPGNILEGSFQPYVRIARSLSIVAGVSYILKRADQYAWGVNQEPIEGLDPAVLAQQSEENAMVLSAGLSYTHSGVREDGRIGTPIDAILQGQMVTGSTEGRVPATQSVVFRMRVYARLW